MNGESERLRALARANYGIELSAQRADELADELARLDGITRGTVMKIIEDEGLIVLADAWLSGGFVSTENCILWPNDIQGLVTRGAGPEKDLFSRRQDASFDGDMPQSYFGTL